MGVSLFAIYMGGVYVGGIGCIFSLLGLSLLVMNTAFRRFIQRLRGTTLFEAINNLKYRKIIGSHQEVANAWDGVIAQYVEGKIDRKQYLPLQDLGTEKIIWQYWGQGICGEELPETVRLCFHSVDRHADGFKVIRLTDETVADYLNIPEDILRKRERGQIGPAFFSDLLRVMLLATYGGVWLDATIMMTGRFPQEFMQGDHFCYQRDDNEPYKKIWENAYIYYYCWREGFEVRMLNSILWAKRRSEMMKILSDLLIYYWQNNDTSKEYFFFQVLYNRLTTGAFKHLKPAVVSDCTPHILFAVILGTLLPYGFDDALSKSHLHKLSYFKGGKMKRLNALVQRLDRNA